MSVQTHSNSSKILIDATGATPPDPENFIPNPKAISSSDPVKVVGVPTAENNIVLSITLLIQNSREFIQSLFHLKSPLETVG